MHTDFASLRNVPAKVGMIGRETRQGRKGCAGGSAVARAMVLTPPSPELDLPAGELAGAVVGGGRSLNHA